jgi:two-component system, response regulator PdtaR
MLERLAGTPHQTIAFLPAARKAPRISRAPDGVSGAGTAKVAPRVLVVEDDFLVSSEIEFELAAAGVDVVGVTDTAEDAVRLAIILTPHLVVMDIRLAGVRDGVDAAIEIFRTRGIRSLLASAYHDPETRRRAEAASPIGWLQKPYTMGSLVDAVRKALHEIGASGAY